MKKFLSFIIFFSFCFPPVVSLGAETYCIEGDCINGQGTLKFSDDSKYIGEFKKGFRHGQGRYTFANGATYVGEWKDNKFNGQGTFTFENGETYTGNWENGSINGLGKYTFTDGTTYVGEWEKGRFHGQGTFTFANGIKNEGLWHDNKFVGESKKDEIQTLVPEKKLKIRQAVRNGNALLFNEKFMVSSAVSKEVKNTEASKLEFTREIKVEEVTVKTEPKEVEKAATMQVEAEVEPAPSVEHASETAKEEKKQVISVSGSPAYEYIPGSMRSLEVPYIEPSPGSIEETAIKHMAPPIIVVDGLLNDALWNKAVVSGGFWASLENKSPTDQTEVLVAMDKNYLYFAMRLYDSKPEEIQATKTLRDVGLGYDDSIRIELDTFFNRRDISKFSLNSLGTQTDEIAGGRSSKIEWKGDWFGAAARTDYGWAAEFAIPFAILNYQQDNTVFGINFMRYQSRTKEYSWWADVTPKNLPEEMGQLRGLQLPTAAKLEKKSWTFMPFVLAGKNIPDKEGEIKDSLFTGGIDIRYQPRSDLTGMISVNPDFSQVEKAVSDISFSYSEKAVDDNRPFFVEGSGYFDDDDEYFYSNRVADFDFGGKGFGRIGKTKFGMFATSAPDDRYDGVARLLYELNDTHSAIMTVTATSQSLYDNGLALAQFKGRQASGLEYSLDAAMTDTREVEDPDLIEDQGNHYAGMLAWKSDYWYLKSEADQYDVEYFPALGLLDDDLPGTRAGTVSTGYYREQSEYFWRVIDSYAGFKYRETEDGMLQNRKWFAGASVEFKNEIRTSGYIEEGPYRPVTDVRGVFEDYTNQDRYYSTAIDFNTRSSVYSFGIQYDWGELGGGDYQYGSAYAWVRPINVVYLNLSYEVTDSFGIYKQTVIVGSWDITPEDSLGARYIYYVSDDGADEYIRVAYGRKVRKGIDVFAVYDKEPYQDDQYSLKLVYSF